MNTFSAFDNHECMCLCVSRYVQNIDWVQTEKHVFEQASNYVYFLAFEYSELDRK